MGMNRILVGVAITMLLLALPAAASDYMLGIFGNANEDDTINMQDVTYTELIILEYRDQTELSDAKHDGKINMQDVTQIELIILGKEKELTILCNQPDGEVVTVHKPIEHIALLGTDQGQAIRAIGARDKVVGVTPYMAEDKKFYPELSKLPVIGGPFIPNIEAILNVRPDIVLCYAHTPNPDTLEDNLEGTNIPVVRLSCYAPDTLSDDIRKLGYLLHKKDEAEEFIDWNEGCISTIKSQTAGLSEDEKPRVLFLRYVKEATLTKRMPGHHLCMMAGGINIAADLPGKRPHYDMEWVIEQDPEVIVYVISSSRASCGYEEDDPSELREARDEIMNDPIWSNIAAVKNERVYLISSELWSEPDYVVGVAYLAKWFHPELFKDLDPEAINTEYLEGYQGVPYRGVWVDPSFEES